MLTTIQSDENLEALTRCDLIAGLQQDKGGQLRRQLIDALLEYEVLLKAEMATGLSRDWFVLRQQQLDAVKAAVALVDTYWQHHHHS
jgi:hypothetical protein